MRLKDLKPNVRSFIFYTRTARYHNDDATKSAIDFFPIDYLVVDYLFGGVKYLEIPRMSATH